MWVILSPSLQFPPTSKPSPVKPCHFHFLSYSQTCALSSILTPHVLLFPSTVTLVSMAVIPDWLHHRALWPQSILHAAAEGLLKCRSGPVLALCNTLGSAWPPALSCTILHHRCECPQYSCFLRIKALIRWILTDCFILCLCCWSHKGLGYSSLPISQREPRAAMVPEHQEAGPRPAGRAVRGADESGNSWRGSLAQKPTTLQVSGSLQE